MTLGGWIFLIVLALLVWFAIATYNRLVGLTQRSGRGGQGQPQGDCDESSSDHRASSSHLPLLWKGSWGSASYTTIGRPQRFQAGFRSPLIATPFAPTVTANPPF